MSLPQRHHPDRRYYGEELASAVLVFLNNFDGAPSRPMFEEAGQQRIIQLLELLRPIVLGKDVYVRRDPRLRTLERVNGLLRRYRSHSYLMPSDKWVMHTEKDPQEKFALVAVRTVACGPNASRAYETHAATALLKLAELNSVDSLRTCKQCGLWFFARFSHQQFCRRECRIKHNASSEAWKEYKRNYARANYQLHKAGKVRER